MAQGEPLSMRSAVLLVLAVPLTSAFAFQTGASSLLAEARKELFANRYGKAAELYAAVVSKEPGNPDAYYGVVRALLGAHRAPEAYAYADQALEHAPQSGGAEDAAGLASFRKGELTQAEVHFRAALKLNLGDPGALQGLASIYSVLSKYKTARDLMLKAYSLSPDDPSLRQAYADSLNGAERVEALERILASLDADSEQAKQLRFQISLDRATLGRELWRLKSNYASTQVNLFKIMTGLPYPSGVGLRVQVNQRLILKLIVDTGASGISISPHAAKSAGLIPLGEGIEVKGDGVQKPEISFGYLASEIRIGDLIFADCPIGVYRGAGYGIYDGSIGMDLFRRFMVSIDLTAPNLSLVARPEGAGEQQDPTDAGDVIPAGFVRLLRFGSDVALPTSVNDHPPAIFLLEMGSNTIVIDSAFARRLSLFYRDERARVRGAQGQIPNIYRAKDMTLTFAGFRHRNVSLFGLDFYNTRERDGVELAGSLGMPVLYELKLTIDYREGIIRMEYVP
jgi:Flp pilus assembly protein TadD